MPKLSFSKASLHKEMAQLKRYQHYLPSLDLKRQQLIAERSKAVALLTETEDKINHCRTVVKQQLPMLSDNHVDLNGLVSISALNISQENIVGIKLPFIDALEIQTTAYSFMTKPHWVDLTVVQLKQMLELQLRLTVNRQRFEILQQAVKKVTQRVNLFDKVLIPKAQQNIAKIRIFLSDTERSAVIRAKITKQKRSIPMSLS